MSERDDENLTAATLQFEDAAPKPDWTATADNPSVTPEEASQPKRRLLPGRAGANGGGGSKDNATRRDRARATNRERGPVPPYPPKGFTADIERLYYALSLAVTPFDVELGDTLNKVAPEAAKAWDELARKNHAVRRFIVALLQTSAWGNVIAAHGPLVALAFARMMGQSQRQSLTAVFLGQQAEQYANNPDEGNGQGNAAA